MREKFTANARGVMDMAVKYAVEMSCNYVGTEHILLGLLSDSRMVSASILGSKKITLKKTEEQIKSIVGVGLPTTLTPDDITPRC